jgi:hypothetical protein
MSKQSDLEAIRSYIAWVEARIAEQDASIRRLPEAGHSVRMMGSLRQSLLDGLDAARTSLAILEADHLSRAATSSPPDKTRSR